MVRSIFALAAVLSVASASLAGDLVTPPLFGGLNTTFTCKLVNITSTPLLTHAQLIQKGGNVMVDSGPVTLNADDVLEIESVGPADSIWCRFINANKSKVRASLTVQLGGDFTDYTVVPAQ